MHSALHTEMNIIRIKLKIKISSDFNELCDLISLFAQNSARLLRDSFIYNNQKPAILSACGKWNAKLNEMKQKRNEKEMQSIAIYKANNLIQWTQKEQRHAWILSSFFITITAIGRLEQIWTLFRPICIAPNNFPLLHFNKEIGFSLCRENQQAYIVQIHYFGHEDVLTRTEILLLGDGLVGWT